MKQEFAASNQPTEKRAAYEPPAIEESAGFERLALGCTMTPGEQPLACNPTANSAPL
jgi:hypothetical protein